MKINRRSFLKMSVVGASLLSSSSLWSCKDESIKYENEIAPRTILKKGDIILFQGDSITDAKRDIKRINPNDNAALGYGYVSLAANQLLTKYASNQLKIYNRGLSGNLVVDLRKRWHDDTLAVKPTVLSILIGINDFWRTVDQGTKTTVAQYRAQYQKLIEETLSSLPNVKLIIGEPFACRGVGYVTDAWYPKFLEYQRVTFELAKEFNGIFIPYQKKIDNFQNLKPNSTFTTDGIHPTLTGAQLMADIWIESIQI